MHQRITQATGIAPEHAHLIECIMREEVFHSTLDWQTADQIRDAAREAHRIFESDQDHYLAWDAYKRLHYCILSRETELREAEKQGDAMRIKVLGSTLNGLRALERVRSMRFLPAPVEESA
jgi:hypothetical protein